jgi:hypothetical protein
MGLLGSIGASFSKIEYSSISIYCDLVLELVEGLIGIVLELVEGSIGTLLELVEGSIGTLSLSYYRLLLSLLPSSSSDGFSIGRRPYY